MNRIFHARVPWYMIFFLIFLTIAAISALWVKLIIPATLCLLLVIVIIERIIHTTYTITTYGKLIIYKGRFARNLCIPLTDIQRIEKYRSMNFGSFHLTEYLVITYGKDYYATIMPIKEVEFLNRIKQNRAK